MGSSACNKMAGFTSPVEICTAEYLQLFWFVRLHWLHILVRNESHIACLCVLSRMFFILCFSYVALQYLSLWGCTTADDCIQIYFCS